MATRSEKVARDRALGVILAEALAAELTRDDLAELEAGRITPRVAAFQGALGIATGDEPLDDDAVDGDPFGDLDDAESDEIDEFGDYSEEEGGGGSPH